MPNLETKCPLKSEDGKCKSPYREKKDSEDCNTNNCLTCERYMIYRERERFRRVQADNANYFRERMKG